MGILSGEFAERRDRARPRGAGCFASVRALSLLAALFAMIAGDAALAADVDDDCSSYTGNFFGGGRRRGAWVLGPVLDSVPITVTGNDGVLQCPPGSVRVRRFNRNSQMIMRCAAIDTCTSTSPDITVRVCTEIIASGADRGVKQSRCVTCNQPVTGDFCGTPP